MKKELQSTVKRAARITTATTIAGIVVHLTGDPKWLALAPLIAALGKFLRSMFNVKFIPF